MDIIFRKINNISTRFIVYTEDEAHQRGICFIYWKDADQGDQAISDDGYVSECLDRKVYTDKKSRTKTTKRTNCHCSSSTRYQSRTITRR